MIAHKLTLDSYGTIKNYLQYNKYRCCDLSCANPILWGEHYQTGYTFFNDMLVFCKLQNGVPVSFTFPIGEKNHKEAFDSIVSYFEENNMPFRMYLVAEEMFQRIEEWYPGVYQIEYDRDSADYLYETETLASLAGKKLHGKRNHINRFLENYPDYEYEVLNNSNVEACFPLLTDWLDEKQENETETNLAEEAESKAYEVNALRFALLHMEELALKGALIRVDNRVVAFTLGEELTEDTFVVHFEKAYADVQGAYPMINREFVRRELLGRYTYVNREEDMGVPGLRHAKTSYQPIRLMEKGLVSRKN